MPRCERPSQCVWPPFPQALLQPDGRTATLELEPTPIVGTSTGKPICKTNARQGCRGHTDCVPHTTNLRSASTPETGRHWRWTPELLASGPGQSLAAVVSLAVGSSSCCDVTTPCRITFHLGIHKCFPSSQAFTSRRPQGLIPRAFLYVGNCICWTFCYSTECHGTWDRPRNRLAPLKPGVQTISPVGPQNKRDGP